MSEHKAKISWKRQPHPAEATSYSRNHWASFTEQEQLQVSASTEYSGDEDCADPEQLLVAALASCHMLTFLAIAQYQGYEVSEYRDEPVGHLDKRPSGGMAVTRIDLYPKARFNAAKKTPDAATLQRMHAGAHRNCFIGNSIFAEVNVCIDAAEGVNAA
jgi:organic hydroperoxide reductase OsmC/OhrA